MKTKRTRLEKLQHSWMKALPREREAFLDWLGEVQGVARLPSAEGRATLPAAPIATGRYLTPETVERLRAVMAARGITLADAMSEMGLDREDRSLARAMLRQTSLRLKTVEAIQLWLAEYETASQDGG